MKPTLHPTLKRVYDNILKPMFLDYFVKEQELLLDPKHIENVLKLVPDDIRQLALTNWGQNDSSVDRWNSLENTLVEHMKGVILKQRILLTDVEPKQEVMDKSHSRYCVHLHLSQVRYQRIQTNEPSFEEPFRYPPWHW